MSPQAFSLFQLACVAVVLATLGAMARARPAVDVLTEYGALAVAGYIGEETCIGLYGFYAYAPGWYARVHHVPILIPLIWPLVILSARDVVRALYPSLSIAARAAVVGAFVVLDATLMEVLSVRAGFWTWVEPGLLGVPLVGLFGWGFFAAGVSAGLDGFAGRARRVLAVLVLGPALTHALILATWWAVFRWVGRTELGAAGLVAHALAAAGFALSVIHARRAGRGVDPAVWLPRVAATLLFLFVFLATARDAMAHAMVLGATALPYLAAIRLRPRSGHGASEVHVAG